MKRKRLKEQPSSHPFFTDPIARDPRMRTRLCWHKSMAKLPGNPNVTLEWLPVLPGKAVPMNGDVKARAPTAFDLNVLLNVLSNTEDNAGAGYSANVHSLAEIVRGFDLKTQHHHFARVRKALRLWQHLAVHWRRGERNYFLPPPIIATSRWAPTRHLYVEMNGKWWPIVQQLRKMNLPLPLPTRSASATNLILATSSMSEEHKFNSRVYHRQFIARMTGNGHFINQPSNPYAFELEYLDAWPLVKNWYAKHGGYCHAQRDRVGSLLLSITKPIQVRNAEQRCYSMHA